jgi:hypothetical protein
LLWYKAWLETRARFLASLATLTLFSGIFVHHAQALVRPEWKTDFYRLLFVNQQFLVIMWVLSVVLLGMGGIVREKAVGTSSLTLALPVSRAHLLGVRVGMGVLQASALGVVPWVAVFFLSRKETDFDKSGLLLCSAVSRRRPRLLCHGCTGLLIGRGRIYGARSRIRGRASGGNRI